MAMHAIHRTHAPMSVTHSALCTFQKTFSAYGCKQLVSVRKTTMLLAGGVV